MERIAYREVAAAGLLALACALTSAPLSAAQVGHVVRAQKISSTSGGLSIPLEEMDQFGRSIVNLGDLDGDGVTDLLVGAHTDDDGGVDKGAVYVLFLHANGFIKESRKISDLEGNFSGRLRKGDQFGRAAASLGDLDGDGVTDLAVGANYDDDGGANQGAVYVLFLNPDASVKSSQKISALQGGLPAPLSMHDEFGRSITSLGDLDGDGVVDLLVGTPEDDEGGTNTGALHVLFLATDGTVARYHRISKGSEGLAIKPSDWFGFSSANLGDFDGDGVTDVVVGAVLDDDGGVNQGSIWILLLDRDGSVKEAREIDELEGGLTAELDDVDQFGTSVANLGDLDGDGVTDIGVGAVKDDDGGTPGNADADVGAVYVLFMSPDASVKSWVKISDTAGDLPYDLDQWDWFGSALARYGGSLGDGYFNAVVGCRNDDDAGDNRGAIYLLQLNDGTVPSAIFGASRTQGIAPLSVGFIDESQGEVTAWLWSFGDGQQSRQRSPSTTYDRPGSYDVQLTVRGPGGIDVETQRGFVTVTEGVLADFGATPRSGPRPLAVSFDDRSQGEITSWSWDLGDGTTSSERSPFHVYGDYGSYAVSLTVSGPLGTDTSTLPDCVVVALQPPEAGFAAAPTVGEAPLAVQFVDTTRGQVTGWSWDFGDGCTASVPDPLHEYEAEGLYSVGLTAHGPGGADTRFEFDLVDVRRAPIAPDFDATPTSGTCPLAVSFVDRSEGEVTSWSWDLGDGTTTRTRHPVHVYATPGVYGVALTAAGPGGSRTLTRAELITVEELPPDAAPTPRVTRISATAATIEWTTRELSTSLVRYGTTAAYGSIVLDAELTISHAVALTGLSPSTLYHFGIESTDEKGDTLRGADSILRTGELSVLAPTATTVLQGKRKGGDFAKLAKDDGKYFEVESTKGGTRWADWYASATVPVVPAEEALLTLEYGGKSSKTVTQSLHLWSWSASAWELLDTRSVSAEQLVAIGPLPATPYVSAAGEIRLRVAGTSTREDFNASGDLARFSLDSPGSSPHAAPPRRSSSRVPAATR